MSEHAAEDTGSDFALFPDLRIAYLRGLHDGHGDEQRERSEAVSAAFARGQAAALAFMPHEPGRNPMRITLALIALMIFAGMLGWSMAEAKLESDALREDMP